jgi:hypothetical protein
MAAIVVGRPIATGPASLLPYVRADLVHLPQNLTSVPVEDAAGRSRHNPLRASEQEFGL